MFVLHITAPSPYLLR